jgi:hypothetical protein
MLLLQWTSNPSRPHFVSVACSGTNPNGSEIVRLPHNLGQQQASWSSAVSTAATSERAKHSKAKLTGDIRGEVTNCVEAEFRDAYMGQVVEQSRYL